MISGKRQPFKRDKKKTSSYQLEPVFCLRQMHSIAVGREVRELNRTIVNAKTERVFSLRPLE